MWFKKKKDIELFNHPIISKMDEQVAYHLKINVISSDQEVLKQLSEKEQKQSGIKSLDLLPIFEKNNEKLTKFICYSYSQELKIEQSKVENSKALGLSKGFSITYAIYYYFLKNEKKKELLHYLSKRKIPRYEKFNQRLDKYFFQSKGVIFSDSYIQYATGYNKENVNYSDIEKALKDIKVMDEEHMAFWISMLVDDEEFIIEVNKDLNLTLIFGKEREFLHQSQDNKEVKNILELHINKEYDKIMSMIKK